jgi:hypothetical protein
MIAAAAAATATAATKIVNREIQVIASLAPVTLLTSFKIDLRH